MAFSPALLRPSHTHPVLLRLGLSSASAGAAGSGVGASGWGCARGGPGSRVAAGRGAAEAGRPDTTWRSPGEEPWGRALSRAQRTPAGAAGSSPRSAPREVSAARRAGVAARWAVPGRPALGKLGLGLRLEGGAQVC